MGNCFIRSEKELSLTLSQSNFNFIKRIGRGKYSTVWQVTHKPTKFLLAIKEYSKSRIPDKDFLSSVSTEMRILSLLNYPLIVNIHFAFRNNEKFFLGLDLKQGGDLRYQLIYHDFSKSESEAKFVIACVILALSYVHRNNIIHKDVKPENIMFDSSGYAFLSDFESSEFFKDGDSSHCSGTVGYMAPEVLFGQEYGFVSDFFAVGVILFEMMFKVRPYVGCSKEIKDGILKKQIQIEDQFIPKGWSKESADFCNKLLIRGQNNRLGSGGAQEVLGHPWMKDVDFQKLERFEVKPGFVPKKEDNFDLWHVNNKKELDCSNVLDENDDCAYSYIRDGFLISKST